MLEDRCEALCNDVADAIARCKPDTMSWQDVGASSKAGFTRECKRDWDDTSSRLDARDLELALDVCQESSQDVQDMTCDEVLALYGPAS